MPFSKPHNTQRCQMNSTVSLINWLAERNPTICSKLPWRWGQSPEVRYFKWLPHIPPLEAGSWTHTHFFTNDYGSCHVLWHVDQGSPPSKRLYLTSDLLLSCAHIQAQTYKHKSTDLQCHGAKWYSFKASGWERGPEAVGSAQTSQSEKRGSQVPLWLCTFCQLISDLGNMRRAPPSMDPLHPPCWAYSKDEMWEDAGQRQMAFFPHPLSSSQSVFFSTLGLLIYPHGSSV